MNSVSDAPKAAATCCAVTKNGSACKSGGRYGWDGKSFCKTHLPTGECPICLENVTGRSEIKLSCGHCFHNACMRKWVRSEHVTCPMCRTTIADPVLDKLLPCSESIETFVIDFQQMGQPSQDEMERFIMNIINMHILGIQNPS